MSVNTFNVYYKSYKNFLKTALKEKKKFKPLIFDLLKNRYGRNNKGFITMYTRGGGVKRLYKRVCFSYINL